VLSRLRILAAVTALALAGSAAACSASSRAVASCATPGAHRIASSAGAEVYSTHGAVWGCSAATHLRTKLGNTTSCIRSDLIGPVRLVGELTAYADRSCGVDTGFASVIVRRLSDGKRLSSDGADTGRVLPESYESVDSLVLKRDGSVAWIAVARSIVGTAGADIEVHRHDKHGKRLLDSGAGIDAGSLRLRRSKLTWNHGGATRSAALS
jgi:hypothetical protein